LLDGVGFFNIGACAQSLGFIGQVFGCGWQINGDGGSFTQISSPEIVDPPSHGRAFEFMERKLFPGVVAIIESTWKN